MRQIQWVHILNHRPSITPAPHGVAYHRRDNGFRTCLPDQWSLFAVDTILPERNAENPRWQSLNYFREVPMSRKGVPLS